MSEKFKFKGVKEFSSSLIYQLERKIDGVKFTYITTSDEIVCEGKEQPIPEELQHKIVDLKIEFEEGLGKLAKRVKKKTVWKTDFTPSDSNYKPKLKTALNGTIHLENIHYDIMVALDRVFEKFCVNLGAKRSYCSSLISSEKLKRCGYLPEKQEQVNFLSAKGLQFDCCLTPAACLPLYPILEGQRFGEEASYTFNNKVYRTEHFVFDENFLERNWEYPIREFVYFYKREEEKKVVFEKYSEFMLSFAKFFHLPASLENAHDMFFHKESSNAALHQVLFGKKYETLIERNYGNLAVSSINFHDGYFSEAFDIKINNEYCNSMCIGWGLGRLIKSCLDANDYNESLVLEKLNDFFRQV